MAKQHVYTRAKQGLYTQFPGFDTVGVSKGLSEGFVKSNIERFCFYDSNNQGNEVCHPPIYFFSHFNDGGNNYTIYGRTIFVLEERDSFLSHSLIFDAQEYESLYHFSDRLFSYKGFLTQMPDPIDDMPEIEMSQLADDYTYLEKDLLFSYLDIDDYIFTELLYHVFLAVIEEKQLYVKLHCDQYTISSAALLLMKYIVLVLPRTISRRLQFISFAQTIHLRNFFHVLFLDPELYIENSKNVYVFDVANPSYFTMNEKYFSFVRTHLQTLDIDLFKRCAYLHACLNGKESLTKDKLIYFLNQAVDRHHYELLQLLKKKVSNVNKSELTVLASYQELFSLCMENCSELKKTAPGLLSQAFILLNLSKESAFSPAEGDVALSLREASYIFYKEYKKIYGSQYLTFIRLSSSDIEKVVAPILSEILIGTDLMNVSALYYFVVNSLEQVEKGNNLVFNEKIDLLKELLHNATQSRAINDKEDMYAFILNLFAKSLSREAIG